MDFGRETKQRADAFLHALVADMDRNKEVIATTIVKRVYLFGSMLVFFTD